MSGPELLSLLEWTNAPLALLRAPAHRLWASALAPDGLRWEIEAWRAELAELTDLEAPWLWEEGDPFGGLPTPDHAPEPAAPQPEPKSGSALMATGTAMMGNRRAASEESWPGAPGDSRESWFKSPPLSPDIPSGKESESRSSDSAIGLAMWAIRRGKPRLAGAARTPIGQPRGSAELLHRYALAKAFEDRSLTAPPTGQDLKTVTEEPGRVHSSFPTAAGLLSRLADRWFAVHPGPSAPHQPHAPSEAASVPRNAGVTSVEFHGQPGSDHRTPDRSLGLPLLPSGPARSSLAPELRQAVALEGDEHTAYMRWVTPIAYNTIHLTVQSPPLVDALDPDDLAELLDRILRQEARRYGILL
ncbi:MAG: hypothetical protein RML36_09205 [Anaerolineae bacterium]|nr:hypothetical protein [Anaerolineae bacterium]MDW8099643.1 hypothetical protein [Anaerolineae bacterium]